MLKPRFKYAVISRWINGKLKYATKIAGFVIVVLINTTVPQQNWRRTPCGLKWNKFGIVSAREETNDCFHYQFIYLFLSFIKKTERSINERLTFWQITWLKPGVFKVWVGGPPLDKDAPLERPASHFEKLWLKQLINNQNRWWFIFWRSIID